MCRITLGNTVLRLVVEEDAQFILQLRLDESLNRFLSKVDSNQDEQREWIKRYKCREREKLEYYFIIESRDSTVRHSSSL